MAHPLDDARLKVVRAQEHLKALKSNIRDYLDTHPYEITVHKHGEGPPYPYPLVNREPPPEIALLIGDCLSNVRPPLDYIVWQLAVRYFDPPIVPDEDLWVSFPIYRDKADAGFVNKINRFTNRKMPADAIAEIKAVQPDDRRYEPLWWLHQLVNMDKHRLSALTTTMFPNFTWIEIEGIGPMFPAFGHHLNTPATDGGETVKVKAKNPVCVSIDDPAMEREPVDLMLEQIINSVANVIPRFDRFFS
jgi:hypothetical protein